MSSVGVRPSHGGDYREGTNLSHLGSNRVKPPSYSLNVTEGAVARRPTGGEEMMRRGRHASAYAQSGLGRAESYGQRGDRGHNLILIFAWGKRIAMVCQRVELLGAAAASW